MSALQARMVPFVCLKLQRSHHRGVNHILLRLALKREFAADAEIRHDADTPDVNLHAHAHREK